VPVPLDPHDPSVAAIGEFFYAGGLHLTARQTDRLHELSDIVISGEDKITAVGDEAVLFEARLVLDDRGRLVGVKEAILSPLTGTNGRPLTRKSLTDAEGLARLPNGDLLVSFESPARIWLYPASGGPPHNVPSPRVHLPSNAGLEALTTNPEAGGDGYIVGAEATGATWKCRVSASCVPGPTVDMPKEFGLVSLNSLPGGRLVCLLRAYDKVRGSRIILKVLEGTTVLTEMNLAAPLTVDNFEGVASVTADDGRVRFYLVSDDNGSASQRTLLLAFDWQPRQAQAQN
jgi:hypothetical protein